MGAMDTRNMWNIFAVNKYLHTVASCWILSYGNGTSKYGSGLCTHCFNNWLSKHVTYLSRTCSKCSEFCTFFRHFARRKYFLQIFFKKIIPVPKIPKRKYSIKKIATLFFISEAGNKCRGKRKKQRGNKGKYQRNLKCKHPPILQVCKIRKCKKRQSIKTIFIIKRQQKVLKRSTVIAGEIPCTQLRKMTGSNTWAAETGCTRSVPYTQTNT